MHLDCVIISSEVNTQNNPLSGDNKNQPDVHFKIYLLVPLQVQLATLDSFVAAVTAIVCTSFVVVVVVAIAVTIVLGSPAWWFAEVSRADTLALRSK